jgi:hypothetical protein
MKAKRMKAKPSVRAQWIQDVLFRPVNFVSSRVTTSATVSAPVAAERIKSNVTASATKRRTFNS